MERGPGNPDGTLPDDGDVAGTMRHRGTRELSWKQSNILEEEGREKAHEGDNDAEAYRRFAQMVRDKRR